MIKSSIITSRLNQCLHVIYGPCKHTKSPLRTFSKFVQTRITADSLRPVRLVLTSDGPVDKSSAVNNLISLADIQANIVACSHFYQKKYDGIKAQTTEQGDAAVDTSYVRKETNLDEHKKKDLNTQSKASTRIKREKVNFVIHNRSYTVEEWDDFLGKLSLQCVGYSQNILLICVLKFLLSCETMAKVLRIFTDDYWHRSPVVKSYIEYLLESNAFSHAQYSLSFYLQHCLHQGDYSEAIDVCKKLRGRIKVFSKNLQLIVTKCMAMDQDVSYSQELFERYLSLRQTGCLNNRNALYFLEQHDLAAFRQNHQEKGIRIMLELMQLSDNEELPGDVVQAFLECHRYTEDETVWKSNFEAVVAFFSYLYVNSVPLQASSTQAIAHWFSEIKNESWSIAWYNQKRIRHYTCPATNEKLRPLELSQSEFNSLKQGLYILLRKTFGDIVQERNHIDDMGIEHHPHKRHLVTFLEYLLKNGPFDLIVDGANFLHIGTRMKVSFKGKHKFRKSLLKMKSLLMDYKLRPGNKNKKVCFIFQRFAYDDVMTDGKYLLDNACVYFVGKGLADDAMILYGAICSGPQCYFASQDLYRDYAYTLETEFGKKFAKLFKKYQKSRQTYLCHRKYVLLPDAESVDEAVQRSDMSWHFPYRNDTKIGPIDWLCVTKKAVPAGFSEQLPIAS